MREKPNERGQSKEKLVATHKIGREHVVFAMDPGTPPVLRIQSGDTVIFDTRDSLNGVIRSEADLPSKADLATAVPATGPVFVEGAEPGDSLAIRIVSVVPDSWGYTVILPAHSVLPKVFSKELTRIIDLSRGFAEIRPGVRIPLRPFPGLIGVAPRERVGSNIPPGDYGGNMDSKDMVAGTTLYLPVFVPGALVVCGDLHPIQGDGESSSTSVECCGTITLTIELRKRKTIPRPQIETPDTYVTFASGVNLQEAYETALLDMVNFLAAEKSMSPEDAYLLCGLAGDIRICQLVNVRPAARVVIPKEVFVAV
jgi:amidase